MSYILSFIIVTGTEKKGFAKYYGNKHGFRYFSKTCTQTQVYLFPREGVRNIFFRHQEPQPIF